LSRTWQTYIKCWIKQLEEDGGGGAGTGVLQTKDGEEAAMLYYNEVGNGVGTCVLSYRKEHS
jgi:hypothetical protein